MLTRLFMEEVRMTRIPASFEMVFWLGLCFTLTGAPLQAQECRWLHDYAAARQEAREKGRPLVLDFGTANCTWCRKLEATTFRDPHINKLLTDRFVAVKIDAEREAQLTRALGINSFPTLVFAAPDGKILGTHAGYVDVQRFHQQLERALRDCRTSVARDEVPPSRNPVSPSRTRQAQQLLLQAREDFRTRQFICCLERCRELTEVYSDLDEAVEARRLVAEIRNDPKMAQNVLAALADTMGEFYMSAAERALEQGKQQEATVCLERVLQSCASSRHAAAARQRLAQVREAIADQQSPKPVIRAQAP